MFHPLLAAEAISMFSVRAMN